MYVRTYVRTYVHTYVHMYIRTYVCTYVRTYICMYVCIYVYSPPPLYRHLWGNSHLALYRGWRYIEGWHSNEIC